MPVQAILVQPVFILCHLCVDTSEAHTQFSACKMFQRSVAKKKSNIPLQQSLTLITLLLLYPDGSNFVILCSSSLDSGVIIRD